LKLLIKKLEGGVNLDAADIKQCGAIKPEIIFGYSEEQRLRCKIS
jgi:hypothetical protein